MTISAEAIRNHNQPFPVTIYPERGEDSLQVLVRRPDLRKLLYLNVLPLPILGKVAGMLKTWIGQDLDKIEDLKRAEGPDALQLINALTCEALVSPRCVMDVKDLDNNINCIHIEELEVDVRERIVVLAIAGDPKRAERLVESAAAATFPGLGPGEGDPSPVHSVRSKAKRSDRHIQSGDSTGLRLSDGSSPSPGETVNGSVPG